MRENPSNVQLLGGGRHAWDAQVESPVHSKIHWMADCSARDQLPQPLETAY